VQLAVEHHVVRWLKACRPDGIDELFFWWRNALFWWWCPRTTKHFGEVSHAM
jgi:hypothetical protein